jgi:hypothetical protein
MDKELHAVYKIQAEGLLRAERWGRNGPMRGGIDTANGPHEAQKWDNGILFVHFEHGQNPRFFLLKKQGNTVRPFPPILNYPVNTIDLLETVEECASKGSPTPWVRTVFIENKFESQGVAESADRTKGASTQTFSQVSREASAVIFNKIKH